MSVPFRFGEPSENRYPRSTRGKLHHDIISQQIHGNLLSSIALMDHNTKGTNLTLLLIRMLQRKACFSDEDRRFKVVCPFLLLGFKRLLDFGLFVRQSRSG